MKSLEDTSTRLLACAPLEIVSDRRATIAMRTALVAVLVALSLLAGLRLYAGSDASIERAGTLQQRNAALSSELSRLQAELELERATRLALERQVAELTEQASDLESRLNFFNSRSGRTRN